MLEQMPTLLSAVVADVFALHQLPGGSVAGIAVGTAVSRLLRRRVERAREIFLEELRHGETTLPPDQIDEGVAIVYRYFRAAQEGAARINLRLMAQAIAGRARLSNLSADEFLRDADMIASLRRDEIILLAEMHRVWTSDWFKQMPEEKRYDALRTGVEQRLVPSLFKNSHDLRTTAAAVVRTGLVMTSTLWDGGAYRPTSKMERFVELAPLDEALAQEGRSVGS